MKRYIIAKQAHFIGNPAYGGYALYQKRTFRSPQFLMSCGQLERLAEDLAKSIIEDASFYGDPKYPWPRCNDENPIDFSINSLGLPVHITSNLEIVTCLKPLSESEQTQLLTSIQDKFTQCKKNNWQK